MADNLILKILITTDTIGGVWNYTVELMKSCSKYPIKFYLATFGSLPNEQQKKDLKGIHNVTAFHSSYKLEWMEDCWEEVEKAENWLRDIHNYVQPDIVHLNNFSAAFLNSNTPVLTVIHSCVLSWWRSVKGHEAPENWDRYKGHVKNVLHGSTIIVAPSNTILSEAEIIYGSFQHSKVIFNGRNLYDYKTRSKEPIIFCIGRIWDEAKNISLLEAVAPYLQWPVIVAG